MGVQDILLENLRKECCIPFFGPLKGKRTPHTSFRIRSRGRTLHGFFWTAQWAVAEAIILKKVRRHSSYVYGKIRLYARPKITTIEPHGGGVV